jgi:glycosyltransferase involved in cell wall biosynthesis
VAKQSYKDWECILVDNGSSDGTLETISHFVESRPGNWKILSLTENLGPSNARNAGIRASQGDFIALLDGDDLWSPNKLASQLRFMQDHTDVSLSLTHYLVFSESSKRIRYVSSKSIDSLIHGWLSMSSFGGLVESTGMLRKADLNDNLFFDNAYMGSEGLDFVIRWASQLKVGIIEEPLTLYRISESQLHTNEEAIKENVRRLTNSLSVSANYKMKVTRSQDAYFYISSLARGRFSREKIIELLHPVKAFSRLYILNHLIKRNLISLVRGLNHKRVL